MAILYGKKMSKHEIMQRVGEMSQIAGARLSRLQFGKADGVPAIDFKTGAGLNFTVLPGRGMDISWADYKGKAIGFISKTGIVDACYYENDYDGFHRTFFAGLLTTCGLRNIGKNCIDGDEPLGLHGRISNTPAYDISISNEWENDEYIMQATGKVCESKLYGENLLLTRKISARMGENKISIYDTIENCGFKPEPLTLLYHCNLGFPLLDEESELILPIENTIPRDMTAEHVLKNYNRFESPQDEYPETVFYHTLKQNDTGHTYAALFNHKLGNNGLGLAIKYNKENLPYLIQWKNMGKGDYVVALEPANCYPEGRDAIRRRGNLTMINPGEIKYYSLEFVVLEGQDDLLNIKQLL